MEIVKYLEHDDYEQLVICVDRNAGLRAFIAIHDTTLGPALGGCRIWPHASEQEALEDVLRLARAMTYKNAAAGLNLGGGKALIWADPLRDKDEGMLKAFGQFVNTLGGRYITTEDVGSNSEDMVVIKQETQHVVGLPKNLGGSGDPSEATAVGIWQGMKACAQEIYGTESLAGMRVVLQGFGKVASNLAEHLKGENADITATDVNHGRLEKAESAGFHVIENPQSIFEVPCEIFSPCALGGSLNSQTIPKLNCKIVAGTANNQLQTEEDSDLLSERGILYAPDYVINAGGVINLSFELGLAYDQRAAFERVSRIKNSISDVVGLAKMQGITTNRAAAAIAEQRIKETRSFKRIFLQNREI